ncbi:MAG: hypothetical protein WDN69_22150 [Aliidongia sp.]
MVTSTTATVLGAALRDAVSPVEAIAAAIGKRTKLLIFDNCEHLIGAAAELIAALLERAPSLSVLATSQENLHVPGERIYRLKPARPAALGGARSKGQRRQHRRFRRYRPVRRARPRCRPALRARCRQRRRRRRDLAGASTAFRWPWRWPQPGCPCSASTGCWRGSTKGCAC